MRRSLITALGAATTVAALGVSGCTGHDRAEQAGSLPQSPPRVAAPPSESGPPPAPETLADVIHRLADPAVAGVDKLPLVQNTTRQDATALDRFAVALRDGGFAPITVVAADVRWSDTHPGDAVATINITGANAENPGGFSFPMEFRRNGDSWQLTRETADTLLAFGTARTDPAVPDTPPPAQTLPVPPAQTPPP